MKKKKEDLVKLKFKGNEISFNWDCQDLMVNATEMAKIFGKDIDDFKDNKEYDVFIENLKKSPKFLEYVQRKGGPISPPLEGETYDYYIKSLDKYLINSIWGRSGGVYMYRTLAIKFAAWLSPEFEIWIYETIENLLFSEKSYEIINYLQKYPQEREMRDGAEVELKEARTRSHYFKLEEEENIFLSKIENLKDEQKQLAIKSLMNNQGNFFTDSRQDLYDAYVKAQEKINKLESGLKSIRNKKALINQRIDIKQMQNEVNERKREMRRLKRSINV